jgi:hypothetical protein
VLPSRKADADAILDVYPDAELHVLHTAFGGDVQIYTIDAQRVREVYTEREDSGDDESARSSPR